MNRLARLFWIARAVGVGNLPRRLRYLLKQHSGYFRRRLPAGEPAPAERAAWFVDGYRAEATREWWDARARLLLGGAEEQAAIRATLERVVPDALWTSAVAEPVRRLPLGELRYFSREYHPIGWPPRFNYDPLHDHEWPAGRHWTGYHQFDPAERDIKGVWEASRFGVAWALGRAAIRDRESFAGPLFWEMLAAWDAQNPVGATVNWSNGQEAAFRSMAWIFAAAATLEHATPHALHRLTELLAHSARLIEVALDYARGQKNNHAISEAAALWTIGALCPELRDAPRWRALGREILAEETSRQFYADGSYVQHSVAYHRVALDVCLWAMWLAARTGDRLVELEVPVGRGLEWLLMMIEPDSGDAPNYGPNDGSWVLPLACTDYRDFRPIAQALHYLLRGTRCFSDGPWDELTLWLFGPRALEGSVKLRPARRVRPAPDGGYFPTAGARTWGMIRIHSYVDRPAQADMLHLDWWLGGANVLRDGGSYLYYTDPPWQGWFDSTAAHNTVEVDGRDQMERGPNFLWFRWLTSRVLRREENGDLAWIQGEHDGYHRLSGRITHQRGVLRLGDVWVVVDDVLGSGMHAATLRWRLRPSAWRFTATPAGAHATDDEIAMAVYAPAGAGIALRAGAIDTPPGGSPAPIGWESRYYAERTPAPTIVARAEGPMPFRFVTIIRPADLPAAAPVLSSVVPERSLLLTAGGYSAALRTMVEELTGGTIGLVDR